ncbi:MAG TPA: ATP-binding protein [Gaiellaceae bacterium]|nr:ATP-binding protein [Gaiellaceae bacterium]
MADGFTLGTNSDGEPLVLDPRDLTTHGVIVGMTGSGKTGLAIVLLEEALLAGTPVLVLDPKGDMGNLLLTFPDLSAASFAPWVSESEAREARVGVEEYAAQTAGRWKAGLAEAGIGPERIQALRDAADFTIYTPGSTAGVPLNVIGSLRAPALSWESEAETLRDEIEGIVSSLLGLVGLKADPLSSREHVLLSNLIENAWRAGRDLDLGALIGEVQAPPIRKLGVFEIDAFFPPKERTELALKLNALVASPAFAAWGEGEPLDPAVLLGEPGKPRAAIVSLAHLSEEERQFVVTLVLSKVVTWMRGLPGTSDLRALVYMDEVFGFAPPTAAPPSKKPILTIFKQARAFGVGMVLSTQNPVDLDYKAMSNAGTWFVGRLQTERDKERVLEALRSAAGDADIGELDTAIGGLEKRQFLLVSAHEPKPVVFSTRFAMSFLRGPLTKDQIGELMRGVARPAPVAAAAPVAAPPASDGAPAVAAGTPVYHLDPAAPWAASVGATPGGTRLRAFLAARLSLRYDDATADLDETEQWQALYGPLDDRLDLASETPAELDPRDLRTEAPASGEYVAPAVPIGEPSFFRDAEEEIRRHVTDARTLTVYRNRALKLFSRPGESEEQFLLRTDTAAQAAADAESAKIKDRLEAKRDRLEAAIEAARRRADEIEVDKRSRGATELLAGAGSVLSVLLGGKANARTIARAGSAIGTAASRRAMTARASERAKSAQDKLASSEESLEELEQEIVDDVVAIDAEWDAKGKEIEPLEIRLESSDVRVDELALVWVPTA